MKNWFLSLTLRERTMVKYAASILAIFITYFLIIEPVMTNYAKNKKNLAASTQTLKWMQSAATEISQLRGGGTSLAERPQGKQFILSMVDRSARKAGLGNVMKRVQPEGDSGVRVWFENAVFDELINWLSVIESQNALSVNEINIEQTETAGLVNVRVFLD